jgi:RNase P/RNase MRP subunit POP5
MHLPLQLWPSNILPAISFAGIERHRQIDVNMIDRSSSSNERNVGAMNLPDNDEERNFPSSYTAATSKAPVVSRNIPTTRTVVPQSMYMRIKMETVADSDRGFSSKDAMEAIVSRALVDSYGIAGSSALHVEILEFDMATRAGILKVPASATQDIWAALTLLSQSGVHAARIIVSHVTPFLLAIARK